VTLYCISLDLKDTPACRKPLSRQSGPSSSTNSTAVGSSRNVRPGLTAPPTTPMATSFRPISSSRKAGPSDSPSTVSKPTSSRTTSITNAFKSDEVQCTCKLPAMLKTVVRETASKGRSFWRCSNYDGCSFFSWADEGSASDPRTPMANVPAKRPYSTVS
jgi:DNA topoisomerase-3